MNVEYKVEPPQSAGTFAGKFPARRSNPWKKMTKTDQGINSHFVTFLHKHKYLLLERLDVSQDLVV